MAERAAARVRYQEKHSGWPNWVTWNVALWLGNDSQAYHAYIAEREHKGPFTAASAKKFVKELWPEGTPDMRSTHHKPFHGGYSAVHWDEIAGSMNEV